MNKKSALVVATVVATLIAGALPADAGNKTKNRKKGAPVVAAPANDSFAAGTQVTQTPFEATIDFTSSSLEANEPQPSCSAAEGTVWYSIASETEQELVAHAASRFPNAIAIYTGSDLTQLSEVTCVADGTANKVMFPAASGALYFVQVSGGTDRQGTLKFGMSVDTWETKTLRQDNYSVTIPNVDTPNIVIDGKPREKNPMIYDVSITADGQGVSALGIVTNPLVLPAIHQELDDVAGKTVDVSFSTTYRYDSAQKDCRVYQGDDCVVGLPVTGDPQWYTDGSGSQAEIVVSLRITSDGVLFAERTVAIPFAGQVAAFLP